MLHVRREICSTPARPEAPRFDASRWLSHERQLCVTRPPSGEPDRQLRFRRRFACYVIRTAQTSWLMPHRLTPYRQSSRGHRRHCTHASLSSTSMADATTLGFARVKFALRPLHAVLSFCGSRGQPTYESIMTRGGNIRRLGVCRAIVGRARPGAQLSDWTPDTLGASAE